MGSNSVTENLEDDKQIKSEINKILNKVILHPNPSTGLFNVSVSDNFMNGEYHIYDMLGRLVLSGQITKRFVIDLSSKGNGVYTVRFSKGENIEIRKIIKQ